MKLMVFKNLIVNLEFAERVEKVDDPKFGIRFDMVSGESNVAVYDSESERDDKFGEVIKLMSERRL